MGRLSSNDASCEEGKAAENARMKQDERMMSGSTSCITAGVIYNEGCYAPRMVGLSITPTNFKFLPQRWHPPQVEFERVMQVAYAPTKVRV